MTNPQLCKPNIIRKNIEAQNIDNWKLKKERFYQLFELISGQDET